MDSDANADADWVTFWGRIHKSLGQSVSARVVPLGSVQICFAFQMTLGLLLSWARSFVAFYLARFLCRQHATSSQLGECACVIITCFSRAMVIRHCCQRVYLDLTLPLISGGFASPACHKFSCLPASSSAYLALCLWARYVATADTFRLLSQFFCCLVQFPGAFLTQPRKKPENKTRKFSSLMAVIAVCSKSKWQLAQWASPRLALAKCWLFK